MKYIRNRLNYFRQDGSRIEDTKEFYAAVKEQNDSEPIPQAEMSGRIGIVLLSILVLAVIILIVIGGVSLINSMENPNQIFEEDAVLFAIMGIFFCVGLLFAGIPIVKGLRLKSKCKYDAQATCIGYDDVVVTNKHGAHFKSCPVYRFSEGGTEYTVYDQRYRESTSSLPAIGSAVTVIFDSEDPNRCIINSKVNWNIPSVCVGAIFLFLALALCFAVLNGL